MQEVGLTGGKDKSVGSFFPHFLLDSAWAVCQLPASRALGAQVAVPLACSGQQGDSSRQVLPVQGVAAGCLQPCRSPTLEGLIVRCVAAFLPLLGWPSLGEPERGLGE